MAERNIRHMDMSKSLGTRADVVMHCVTDPFYFGCGLYWQLDCLQPAPDRSRYIGSRPPPDRDRAGSLEYRAWTGVASPARRARYQPDDKSIIPPCIFSLHSVDTDRGTGTALPVPVLDPALFQILHLYPTRRMDGALSGTCGRRGSRRAEWKSLTNGGEGNRKAIRGLRGIEDLSSLESWSWWT